MEILFQLLLKGCTIEAISENRFGKSTELFQLLLKGCTIEAPQCLRASCPRCSFQLLLKGCTIEAEYLLSRRYFSDVSVVVERMYD